MVDMKKNLNSIKNLFSSELMSDIKFVVKVYLGIFKSISLLCH